MTELVSPAVPSGASLRGQTPGPANGTLDVARRILGQQVVDAAGRRCGRVADVEFEGGPGEHACVAALLVGAGHLLPRLPASLRLVAQLARGDEGDEQVLRVPWIDVRGVAGVIRLEQRAEEYRSEHGARRMLLSGLLGADVVSEGGWSHGKVVDVRVDTLGGAHIVGLVVGHTGLAERFLRERRSRPGDLAHIARTHPLLLWTDVVRVVGTIVVVRDGAIPDASDVTEVAM